MLQELSIRQFAIIDDIRISFKDGLTILSGETGAGKSIIINAVNLILGSRASEKMIRTGAESAEVEALFRVEPDNQPNWKQQMGHDRRLDTDRRIDRDRRFGNYSNGHNGTERRSVFDRRGYNERRQDNYLHSKTDLFRIAS
jgi:DNA repair protein RecN (Recombination protein N)